MTRFWRTFWWCIASFGALVALYIGAAAEDLVWAFWVVVAGSVAIAGGYTLGPRALKWANYVSRYPALLQLSGELQQEANDLKVENKALKKLSADQRTEAVVEGRAQVYGALKANSVKVPKVVGFAVADGIPLVLATCQPSQFVAGARYHLEASVTGESKGVVEARDYNEDRQIAALVRVSEASPRFWREFMERAEFDPEPPRGIRLRPLDITETWGTSVGQSGASGAIEAIEQAGTEEME